MSDIPDLSSDEDNFEEEEWQEMETTESSITCLFCPTIFRDVDVALKHCEDVHNFRLTALKNKFNMDFYSYIRMINYIRAEKPSAEVIMNAEKMLWEGDDYYRSVKNDEWLTYDFDSFSEPVPTQSYHANVENGLVTLSQDHFLELQRTIQKLNEQLTESRSHLQMAKEDMDKMRQSMKNIVDAKSDNVIANCVSKVALEDDEGYFNSYAHFGIHYEMLSDKVRTESYRQAIMNNDAIFKDKVVLDLGCGTGILSMFAATAGAKTVLALDQSDIAFHAMVIIKENNLNEKIRVIKGRLENIKLDEKVDIIVSEWMGYFLLFEGMLDSVIYARENCLKPNGLLLPNRCNISLIANGDVHTHSKLIEFWSNVYNYKMDCMKAEVTREASIDVVDSTHILTSPCVIKDIDINTCDIDVMNFSANFKLPVMKSGAVTSLVGYFDTFFDLPSAVSFSTGPQTTPTHWKQTVFYFKDCNEVKVGDVIDGTITCARQKIDVRALEVDIHVFGKSHKYILS